MMYPRLYLARNLLREDGVIFISIDDNEFDNLHKICDEIFGEENFIATVIWHKMDSPKNSAVHLSVDHDYIVIYARNAETWRPNPLPRTDEMIARYKNIDNDPRGDWLLSDLAARNYYAQGRYPITTPSGKVISGPPAGSYWRVSREKFDELDKDNRIWWGKSGDNRPGMKRFLSEVREGVVPQTYWPWSDVGSTRNAKQELSEVMGAESGEDLFITPKPTQLIHRILKIATKKDESALVLDFFAGSGSTMHAVLQQNKDDNGNRQCILVQLPEPLENKYDGLKNIADITKKRVRRVIQKLNQGTPEKEYTKAPSLFDEVTKDNVRMGSDFPSGTDLGFRVFKLAESNFKGWEAQVPGQDPAGLVRQLEMHIEHLREGRSSDDLLYEILLKSGFPLTTPVETLTPAISQGEKGKSFYSVAGGTLLICLEKSLTLEVIRAMAALKPERVVCLDAGFGGDDALKANAVQIFKTQGAVFKTV